MAQEHVLHTKIVLALAFVFFVGCSQEEKQVSLDGKKLMQEKCASCHNLEMPPVISQDELAPPMMAVSFHVHSFVKASDESQRTPKAIAFVVDYVLDPSLEKSFCDKESLERYGLMPSQKGSVTAQETKAIATYMFQHFTQENLAKEQKLQNEYNAFSEGKKLALKHKCLGCHRVDKKVVGPSFVEIAKRYQDNELAISKSIKNGSKEKWEGSRAIMPAFKEIKDKDLEILSKWILETKKSINDNLR